MKNFIYNDMEFSVESSKTRWDLFYKKADGQKACVGTGLFEGVNEAEAVERARILAKSIFPVGIRLVGPDVAHPMMVGDLKIVPPDVVHPNFIYWDRDSLSIIK